MKVKLTGLILCNFLIYMNQILQDYRARFFSGEPKKWDYFFTQLDNEQIDKLPYINMVENFCGRVSQAIDNQERICIYSDYDTDAVTATATMYWGLIELGVHSENLDFYAPDRFTEGYGMNTEAARKLGEEYDLIITVDCGINSREEASIIKNSRADLLITDHHHLDGEVPDAKAVVNPRLNVLELSIKNYEQDFFDLDVGSLNLLPDVITGVGVAWFAVVWLAYYLRDIKAQPVEVSKLNFLLPYVAIGTIADCQSIIEPTNRLLVKTGLSILQSKPFVHPGLEALTSQLGLREKIGQGYRLNSQDLGYLYSPVLNSSGRISHARLSIATLLSPSKQEAFENARQLIETNQQRKQLVKDILEEVEEVAKEQRDEAFLWLVGGWSKGVVGLLASRLVNQYDKPVIVISLEEGKASASLRAPEGYHLPETMTKFGDLFDKAGGHPCAAGFSAREENLSKIKSGFEEFLPAEVSLDTKPEMDLATVPQSIARKVAHKSRVLVARESVDDELKQSVFGMDPFGQDFPMPEFVFALDNDFEVRFMGQNQNHAKIQTASGAVTMFNLSSEVKEFLEQGGSSSSQLWLGVRVSQNTWNGHTNLELIVQNHWLVYN